uniref:Uncharacterized protein n=1 Tax=Caenorhabditis japonica TaxID=281687 RepID=A0A8R1HP84_CAEJA
MIIITETVKDGNIVLRKTKVIFCMSLMIALCVLIYILLALLFYLKRKQAQLKRQIAALQEKKPESPKESKSPGPVEPAMAPETPKSKVKQVAKSIAKSVHNTEPGKKANSVIADKTPQPKNQGPASEQHPSKADQSVYQSDKCLNKTSHSSSMMVFGGICADAKIQLVLVNEGAKINPEYYIEKILESEQDREPAPCATATQQCWEVDFIGFIYAPSSSPDLNPWISQSLKIFLKKAWDDLDVNTCVPSLTRIRRDSELSSRRKVDDLKTDNNLMFERFYTVLNAAPYLFPTL